MYSPLSQAMNATTVELGPVSSYVPEDITCFSWVFVRALTIVPAGSVWPWAVVTKSYLPPTSNYKFPLRYKTNNHFKSTRQYAIILVAVSVHSTRPVFELVSVTVSTSAHALLMNQEILEDVSSIAGKVLLQTAGPSSPKSLPSILDQASPYTLHRM